MYIGPHPRSFTENLADAIVFTTEQDAQRAAGSRDERQVSVAHLAADGTVMPAWKFHKAAKAAKASTPPQVGPTSEAQRALDALMSMTKRDV